MIEELRIRDLGPIAATDLRFSSGFTVISGETGAGKTMLLNSLQLLLGMKAEPRLVRQSATRAVAEASFIVEGVSQIVERLEELDCEVEDGVLEVARVVPAEGRSHAQAGGRRIPSATLSDMTSELVAIHGQSEQLQLRQSAWQRNSFDQAGSEQHRLLLEEYRRLWAEAREESRRWHQWVQRQEERSELLAKLEEESLLLEELDPHSGEDAELGSRAEKLAHVEDLRQAFSLAHAALAGEETSGLAGGREAVLEAQRILAPITDYASEFEDTVKQLRDVSYILDDIVAQLAREEQELNFDPLELEDIQNRRAQLRNLALRLGVEVDDLAEYRENLGARIARELAEEHNQDALGKRVEELEELKADAAKQLSASRKVLARHLSEAITSELQDLAMPTAEFEIVLDELEELGPWGGEDVSFRLRPRPLAPLLDMGQGVSGGELSRLMLAIEVCLIENQKQDRQSAKTLVFDEIDAGIGGETALEVGRKLKQLAQNYQVIVVTHVAQVAAFADLQLVVSRDEVTDVTTVEDVKGQQRVEEIARMMSGHTQSKTAQRHAAELLELSNVAESNM
ncbi:MAG: AAA family ATPase [Actinomycetaceae bacterium]|nr:AAA family ATPase [Actinomycetaceae bacterium]